MKYKCSNCGQVYEGQLEKCPRCGRHMQYGQPAKEEEKKPAPVQQAEPDQQQPVPEVAPKQELAPVQEEQAMVPAPVEEQPQEGGRVLALNSVSKHDGKLIQVIGWSLLGGLLTIITLGIMYPWAVCKLVAWDCKHTIINGRRLRFTGKAGQIIGKNILWMLLTIITAGIFGLWVPMKWKRWITARIHFAEE